ncbi:DNA glycosylase/AP lyase ROS1-like [Wolffia australiana]
MDPRGHDLRLSSSWPESGLPDFPFDLNSHDPACFFFPYGNGDALPAQLTSQLLTGNFVLNLGTAHYPPSSTFTFGPLSPPPAPVTPEKNPPRNGETPITESKETTPEAEAGKTSTPRPRRKKHRPKVVREAKPAKTPKPRTPKPSTPKPPKPSPSPENTVNTSGKRRYVRKTQTETEESVRSAKRRLDFSLEGDVLKIVTERAPERDEGLCGSVANPVASGWSSAEIFSAVDNVRQPERALVRWNTKKLARMVHVPIIHSQSTANDAYTFSNSGSGIEPGSSMRPHIPDIDHQSIEMIIRGMKSLELDSEKRIPTQEETALVPYSSSTAITTFEGQLQILKKVRPKVVLDKETNRMWNLLMGKESQGPNTPGQDKEKWWEEERRVFRGRVDSFIAKMHLVQGDRRFSPWKGSVLDSVVGVFLTQNVSDHLSSSAFMAMAAKFPPVIKEENLAKEEGPVAHEEQSKAETSKSSNLSPQVERLLLSDNPWNMDSKISFTDLLAMVSSKSLLNLYPFDREKSTAEAGEFSSSSEKVMRDPGIEGDGQRKERGGEEKKESSVDWDELRREASRSGTRKERRRENLDSLDWEAVKRATVDEISSTIRERGMNNMLAVRIKGFLERLEKEHGSIDLEWLRDVPPDKAKDFLLSIKGLGLKSVECVRLLTLHHLAFPVDTNVGRICVRLGWVPLQPLPESLQLHLLELYPMLETIQKYLWPRLCTLDQRTLYELHYQMITFGKVFCSKSRPNCNACPLRGECKHFASAFASARLALPSPEERRLATTSMGQSHPPEHCTPPVPQIEANPTSSRRNCEPIVEEPDSPKPESPQIPDIEDLAFDDPDEIPVIRLNVEEFSQNLQDYLQKNNGDLQDFDFSKALVMINQETASIPAPKLKNISRLRTEHQVYELPDSHPLLEGLDKREAEDPCPYLLAIWSPGETAQSVEPPESCGNAQNSGELCDQKTCFSCNSMRESQSQTVRGTLLIPCRTAMRGSFPLNGTYFQVNEVFADHKSSLVPLKVPRSLIWNLPRRTVCFGTSVPTIFRGLSIQEIQNCFWRGFVCVRGFDRATRGPRPLMARLHSPASKVTRNKRNAERDDE